MAGFCERTARQGALAEPSRKGGPTCPLIHIICICYPACTASTIQRYHSYFLAVDFIVANRGTRRGGQTMAEERQIAQAQLQVRFLLPCVLGVYMHQLVPLRVYLYM